MAMVSVHGHGHDDADDAIWLPTAFRKICNARLDPAP